MFGAALRGDGAAAGATLFMPYCPDPLTARLCTSLGFDGGYVSGAGLGYSLALSEALLGVRDLADVVHAVRRRSDLPLVVDGGVGFGDAVHVQRSMWELESAGAHAVEFEDQVAPKRVSHHRGVEHLVPTDVMAAKIRFAVAARQDPNVAIIARTGAIQNETFDDALKRGDAYRTAGADAVMIYGCDADALASFVHRLGSPVVTLAPFDERSPDEWRALGLRLVIDPQTGHAVSFAARARAYERQRQGLHSGLDDATLARARALFADLTGLDELYEVERQTTEGTS